MVSAAPLVKAVDAMRGLKIEGGDLPPLTLTSCEQSLSALVGEGLHRTVNGKLCCTALSPDVRYRTTIHCTGPALPALGGLTLGSTVRIHCVQRLWQKGQDASIKLTRPAVPASMIVMNAQKEVMSFDVVGDEIIPRRLGRPYFISFCPILTMCITDMTMQCGVGGLNQTWMITAEEVS